MRFTNLDPRHGRPSRWDQLKWITRRRPHHDAAATTLPRLVSPDLELIHAATTAPRVTWIGHASVLLQLGGQNILIDPVFSDRIGWFYRRRSPPGLSPGQLPRIDLILVTHNHYDHLDAPSIAALPRSATVVVPTGLGDWFLPLGFARVVELGWWESADVAGLRVTHAPSRHWSRRGLLDTNATLWGGFVVEAAGVSVYHAGDSAVFDGFAEIGRRFPRLAAALLPIGGYAPQWFMQHNHFTPEDAGAAFLALGAKRFVPIHWGAFQLSDEPPGEPIQRLRDWWAARAWPGGQQLCEPALGQTLPLD
jgi:L-ascorbate metabolism protein UlaG (beta-lactamase superfamily)